VSCRVGGLGTVMGGSGFGLTLHAAVSQTAAKPAARGVGLPDLRATALGMATILCKERTGGLAWLERGLDLAAVTASVRGGGGASGPRAMSAAGSASPTVGAVLRGRYELLRELGAGGSATTYLARDRRWDTEVTVKLLRDAAAELVEVLHAEFARLRELFHPHLVHVHELWGSSGPDGSLPFYTADFVPGTTLARHAEGNRWESLRRPLGDALSALDLLHRAGVLHGDFKPENVLVREDGAGALIDLGCARPMGVRAHGFARGTPDYLAPELLGGAALDARSDLFAVGVTLRRVGASLAEPLPGPVARLAARLVDPDPARRPANVGELFDVAWPEQDRAGAIPVGLGRLVGRDAARAVARAALAALAAGRAAARVLHLVGAPGMGKSRLLRELHWFAQARARVLEANPDAPLGVRSLLEEAVGGPLPVAAADAAVRAREGLDERAVPCVLLVDDAERLASSESALLAAFARSLEPRDPVLLVVASRPELALGGVAVRRVELGPLGPPDIDALVGEGCSRATRGHLHRLSGGHPGELRALLLALASGSLNESDLVRGAAAPAGPGRVGPVLDALPAAARGALGVLAVIARPMGKDPLAELGVGAADLDAPLRSGLVVREAAGYRLANPRDGARVLAELGGAAARALELRVAEWFSAGFAGRRSVPGGRAEDAAHAALHLARAGEVARAAELLLGHRDEHAMAPQAWLAAAQALAAHPGGFELELAAARLEQMAGLAPAALERLERLLGGGLDGDQRVAARVECGACWLRIGDASRAVLELETARGEASSPDEVARIADLVAQARCRQGRYEEALRVVDEALAGCSDAHLRASLDEAAGVALGYLGRFEAAAARLDAAAQVPARPLPPRHQVRATSARALVAFQAGQPREAARLYAEALDIAERHGLGDQLASAALNLAAAQHQRGAWAEARAAYERGLRLAVALGQPTTEAHARLNLAHLYVGVGAPARASALLDSCEALARRAGLAAVEASALALRAELVLEDQGPRVAGELLARAREHAASTGDARDQVEIEIRLAELALLAGDVELAAERVEHLGDRVARLDARDVTVRAELARARLLQAQGRPREALPLVEGAEREARELELSELEAEAELLASELWEALGAELLATQHRLAARGRWERAAAALPPELRAGFWQHPRRRAARTAAPVPASEGGATLREHKLRLLVELFRRLNSSLRTEEVLERAMDAAIELTGAERGFLLRLGPEPGPRALTVAVARNVDQEQLERSHSKFSRAIAEQVVSSGEPVVTACARTDQRFSGHESVHALRLQSVVCVPVTSPAGRLGALYLDNRFKTHGFSEADVDLVLAFADQVAIALANATLHQDLERKNRELVAQTERVQELLRERDTEVARLTEQVQHHRSSAGHRHEYGAIIGSSPALERVFDLLDRVIDTELTVLIEGESGTGKELVARAIHQNSARRTGPLVSINCAAVPEPLLEAELFGTTRGAFTGANVSRDGLFVQARGGTLLLDELGEMPLSMQVKLLRVLQEREVRPLGASRAQAIDVRLVCATNRHLPAEVAQGRFREDLYYRVGGVTVRLPPLRERPEDLPLLVDHLLRRAAERMRRPVPELTRAALTKLSRCSWPGNVRQLENVLTRALVMAQGDRIAARDVELSADGVAPSRPLDRQGFARQEAQTIAAALAEHRWNVAEVARALGVSRPTLYRRLQAHGLKRRR